MTIVKRLKRLLRQHRNNRARSSKSWLMLGAVDICSTTPMYRGLSAVSRGLGKPPGPRGQAAGRRREVEMSTAPIIQTIYILKTARRYAGPARAMAF